MTSELLIGLILGIIGSIIASEILDLSGILARALVKAAAKRLPEEFQQRYEEEWLSHLDDMASYPKFLRVYQAITIYLKAVPGIENDTKATQPTLTSVNKNPTNKPFVKLILVRSIIFVLELGVSSGKALKG